MLTTDDVEREPVVKVAKASGCTKTIPLLDFEFRRFLECPPRYTAVPKRRNAVETGNAETWKEEGVCSGWYGRSMQIQLVQTTIICWYSSLHSV